VDVVLLAQVEIELNALPSAERGALLNVIEKLRAIGVFLGAPHTSQVKGSSLRELRPRAGRSPWRAFYRRVGNELVIGAIGPEALHDRQGFNRSVVAAEGRISQYGAEQEH